MVAPERLVRAVERVQQSLYISAPELSQVAAAEAFAATEDSEPWKARYAWNRSFLMERLPALGFLARGADGMGRLRLLRRRQTHKRQRGLRAPHAGGGACRGNSGGISIRCRAIAIYGSLMRAANDDMVEALRRLESGLR